MERTALKEEILVEKDTYKCLPHAERPASDSPCSKSQEYTVLLKSIAQDVDELRQLVSKLAGVKHGNIRRTAVSE